HFVHPAFEAALGDEAVVKTRTWERSREPQTHAAGNHDRARALCERDVAGDRTERKADAVERGVGEAIASLERGRPQRLLIVEDELLIFDRTQRLVDVPQAT